MHKNKLYFFLVTACIAGSVYTAVSFHNSAEPAATGVCFIKHVTGIPCPSCGSTRSVVSILQGDITAALFWNPFGLILFSIMLVTPFWILYDKLKHRSSLFIFYKRMELLLKKKMVFIPAIVLVTANWIWNIYKGL